MAKTGFVDIAPELKDIGDKSLEQSDRFYLGVIQGAKRPAPRSVKERLKKFSLFGFLAPLWRQLSPAEKETWKAAGAVSNITNWQLFISDNAARLRHGLDLGVAPSELWQVRTGYIEINDPADRIILKQAHPQTYWVARPIRGKSWKRELVNIHERFFLPLEIRVRYKTELTETGDVQSARVFARITNSYQAQNEGIELNLNLNPSADWTIATATLPEARGIIIGYEIVIEIIGYRGKIWLDNLDVIHSLTNWARDRRFDDMTKKFRRAFAIVAPFWEVVEQPEGATFNTEYPPGQEEI